MITKRNKQNNGNTKTYTPSSPKVVITPIKRLKNIQYDIHFSFRRNIDTKIHKFSPC